MGWDLLRQRGTVLHLLPRCSRGTGIPLREVPRHGELLQVSRHDQHRGPRELCTGGEWIYGRNPVVEVLQAERRTLSEVILPPADAGAEGQYLDKIKKRFWDWASWENRKDDEPDSPPLLLGVVYSSFPSAEFSGSIVMLDISAGAWPLAPGHLTHLSITEVTE